MSYEIITLKYDRLIEDRETKLAWCLLFDNNVVFLPKSQTEDIRETSKEIDMPRWLAEAKGLEEYEA